MERHTKKSNRLTLFIEIILTVAICFGIAFNSFVGLSAQSNNFAVEVMADYNMLTNDYIRDFKVLRMEAVEQIEKDLSFDEMQEWLQSRDQVFTEAIGENVFDGFAFTYKGGYAHSWNYGDYSNYDPNTRPWYQLAKAHNGEVAVVAPYVTFLSNTDLIEKYDNLRMSIAQRYNDDISFDFDLNVKEINALLADRRTLYSGTISYLFDKDGYILSSTDPIFYGHNINEADSVISQNLSDTLLDSTHGMYGMILRFAEGKLRLIYRYSDEEGKIICLLVPFGEVFVRNFLFVLLLACVLIVIEMMFYHRNELHFTTLEENKRALKEALERAEAASSAKGDFMSRMSHEIRTPLNAVIGYMTIAQMKDSDEEKIAHCLENSELAAKHLLSIINDVLDMSSIESGRIKIAKSDFNLKQQISTIATIFYNQAKNKDVNFEVHITGLTEEWVVGDQMRVNQVIMNLLSNAVKFTPENGFVTLEVEQKEKTESEVSIEFKVKDTGIGMSEEFLNRMFTPFEQETAGTAQKYGGTGLGLAISKNLTGLMNGNIQVDSKQDVGTTFTVDLSFGISKENSKIVVNKKDFSKVRVLIVDDQEQDQSYVKEMLKRLHVKSDVVGDGKAAINRFISRQNTEYAYDLCIIDWKMPDCNGIEVAKEIRTAGGETVPIIIATAYDVTEIDQEAKSAGVNQVIAKPLFQSTLFDLLVNTFGEYEPEGESTVPTSLNLQGKRLLLAEDNEMNMEIAVSILGKAGLITDKAMNGKQAVEQFVNSREHDYVAILMDIQMPIMNGYEATREIRKSNHPQAKTIPIIAMTANAFTSDVEEAIKNGMNGHIAKPVDYEKLYRTLSECIHQD